VTLRTVFAKRDDPYAGLDLANATRIGGAVWLTGAVLAALLLPFAPPDEAIGDAGWPVAVLVLVIAVGAGLLMLRLRSVNVTILLAMSFGGLAAIAVMVWLSGGEDSPYASLYLLNILYTASIHPPRRIAAYLAFAAAVTLLPVTYSHWDRQEVVELSSFLLVWLVLALLMAYQMSVVRAQRLGLRREGETARRQARLDPLTSLPNRRAFDEALSKAIERARANGSPLSVLVGDIDDFKDFNDRFGHLEGDRVLRTVAESLQGALRRPDEAYRWGGDEFAVILPEVDRYGAEHAAVRVETAVARNTGPDGETIGFATGVAELDRGTSQTAEGLLAQADQALLRAKGSGTFRIPGSRG
jgi:diguanylate cyclase (GGDEF)-like protein